MTRFCFKWWLSSENHDLIHIDSDQMWVSSCFQIREVCRHNFPSLIFLKVVYFLYYVQVSTSKVKAEEYINGSLETNTWVAGPSDLKIRHRRPLVVNRIKHLCRGCFYQHYLGLLFAVSYTTIYIHLSDSSSSKQVPSICAKWMFGPGVEHIPHVGASYLVVFAFFHTKTHVGLLCVASNEIHYTTDLTHSPTRDLAESLPVDDLKLVDGPCVLDSLPDS